MGSAPWDCFTEFESDVTSALQKARQRELKEGSYCCSCEEPEHDSFEEAMECADADGTCSILDIEEIATEPTVPFGGDGGVAYPLNPEKIAQLFGTDKPTREQIEATTEQWNDIGRGRAIYVIVYKNKTAAEIYFAGMSYD